MSRELWNTRIGFILAAMGSAIGLGNIRRFNYMVYENGGGAFLIPYAIALATAGISLMILEFAMGCRYNGSAPLAFWRADHRLAWIGWWAVITCAIITMYYSVIIAWALVYVETGGNTVTAMDSFRIERRRAAALIAVLCLPGSLVYATRGGLPWLDIVDHYINVAGGQKHEICGGIILRST